MTVTLALAAWVAVFAAFDDRTRELSDRSGPSAIFVVGGLLGAALLIATGSFVLLVLCPVVAVAAVALVRHEQDRRSKLQRLRQLPVVVDILARRLATGETVASAIASLTPDQLEASGLVIPLAQINSGMSIADALAPVPGLMGAALYAAELSGGSGGLAIERLADRLRSAALDGQAAQSQAGQQLASAAVMTLLPPAVSLLYALSDDRAFDFYLHTPWGALVVFASLALSAVGWYWMRYITRPRGLL